MIPTIKPTLPPVSREDIRAFEERHGVRLPEPYREFLLRSNGGKPFPSWIPFEDDGVPEYVSVDAFYGIADTEESGDGLGRALRLYREESGRTSEIPIAGAGEDSLFLRLDGPPGAVSLGKFYGEQLPLAPTFEAFLALFDYPEDTLPWMRQIHEGDLEGLRGWLAAGGDPNATSEMDYSPVKEAVFVSNLDMLRLLLQHGGKVTHDLRAMARDVSSSEMNNFLRRMQPHGPDAGGAEACG